MKSLIPLMFLIATAVPAHAQGWIEPIRPGPDFGVVKLRTSVHVRVTDRVAQVEVEEWFENRGGRLGEGDYLYPLPGEAVFSNFSLFQGDDELRGETMDAGHARAIYEEIVRRKRDPALIELAGHGLIRARVFPIDAGQSRRIILRYTQVLDRAGDALQFRYAAGGRTGFVPSGEGTGGPRARPAATPVTFVLEADGADRFGDPFSPTHEVTTRRADGRLTVRPASSFTGDFTLFLPVIRGAVGLTVATHHPVGEDGYFMVTVSPGTVDGAVEPRDITAVVDVSGSMSGGKLRQARSALHQLLGTLRPTDRFRLVAFSNRVRAYRARWTRATPDGVRDAGAWIDRLAATGGTNIAEALEEAFRLPSTEGRLPIVVFLTDGLPSVGEQNPEVIAQTAERDRGRARVFAFGVGYDVNTYLLDRLSAAGRGTTEYVEPSEDVEAALGALALKIQHPVLTDLALSGPVRLTGVYPERLPDLFAGEDLVIVGRYERTGTGDVAVSGQRQGRRERFATRGTFGAHVPANDFIPQLWAARKIGVLQQRVRLHGADPELIDEIRETALRYGLLSEYTSYLVQEPEAVAGGRRDCSQCERRMPDAAPTPRSLASPVRVAGAASGAGAVASAESDRARRESRSLSQVAIEDEALFARGHMGQAQHVAGRVFVDRHGVWTDMRHADSLEIVRVEAFSPAYFALAAQLPELEPVLHRFGHVLIAGRAVSIEIIADAGLRNARTVDALVRRFRAR